MQVKLELEFEVDKCSHFIGAAQVIVTGVCLCLWEPLHHNALMCSGKQYVCTLLVYIILPCEFSVL